MSDIFLSYKSGDKAKAQTIAEALERKGYSVWWDGVIPPGRTFDEVIEEKLNAAKCVVVLWSKESVKSKWVKTEAMEGDIRGILIPVLIEEVKPPLAFRMMEAAKLIDWDGTSDHSEFDLLFESVTRIIGRPPEQKKWKKREVEIAIAKSKEEKQKRFQTDTVKKDFTNFIGMKFTLIPVGQFMMGYEEEKDEKPVHEVSISKPFYLGIYPVTQQQWNEVMKNNPSKFKGDNLPIEQVSWNEVQEFIKKLNEKEGANNYRLPSEAEWEYAARAGTTTRYSFGDDESKLGEYAWYHENSYDKTHPVGEKKPNPWGLYDMHGNVWEWVQDEWHSNYNGAPTDGSAWEGREGPRVFRGGSWSFYAGDCRSAARGRYDPGGRGIDLGFRLLRDM